MMKDRIADDLKDAMRARDKVRLRTLRALRTALMEKEIEKRGSEEDALSEEQELRVLQKQAKQRREAIEQYEKADRADLAEKEKEELEVIEEYLPRQLEDEEIREVIREVIDDTGASSMQDMGAVMGPVMQRLRGRADGQRVQKLVRSALSADDS